MNHLRQQKCLLCSGGRIPKQQKAEETWKVVNTPEIFSKLFPQMERLLLIWKNRLISEQNMNPLLQQKCVFCRDGRLPKHKKRQTKPDLLISSVFFKASPTYEQLKKNHLQDSTNSWTKPESLTTAKKFLFKERKLPNTKQHTKSDVLQLFSKTLFKPVPPNENVAS